MMGGSSEYVEQERGVGGGSTSLDPAGILESTETAMSDVISLLACVSARA